MTNRIVFLGMGGTIAGVATDVSDNVGYRAAQVGVDDLLLGISGLTVALGDCQLESEQVAQIDSKDMRWTEWRVLAKRIHALLSSPTVLGIVVTHGTDTLEETAFFLAQVLPSALLLAKPVVITCAMRPATSVSPDGPQNVLDAVAVARSPQAAGVLVVCAGVVHSAQRVQKVHPYRLSAFDSGDGGPLAFVEEGLVRWCTSAQDFVVHAPFLLGRLDKLVWPRVEIVMNFAGASGAGVRALVDPPRFGDSPVTGIVVAGTGNGSLHAELESALFEAQEKGIRVLRTTRCPYGVVVTGSTTAGPVPAVGLSAVKARIALILELLA